MAWLFQNAQLRRLRVRSGTSAPRLPGLYIPAAYAFTAAWSIAPCSSPPRPPQSATHRLTRSYRLRLMRFACSFPRPRRDTAGSIQQQLSSALSVFLWRPLSGPGWSLCPASAIWLQRRRGRIRLPPPAAVALPVRVHRAFRPVAARHRQAPDIIRPVNPTALQILRAAGHCPPRAKSALHWRKRLIVPTKVPPNACGTVPLNVPLSVPCAAP